MSCSHPGRAGSSLNFGAVSAANNYVSNFLKLRPLLCRVPLPLDMVDSLGRNLRGGTMLLRGKFVNKICLSRRLIV